MENYFTVGETAKIVKTTSETLRHYDRIGLVKPSRKEEWTGYRYYSKQDIVRLNTIRALRSMELSLGEIREVLEYDDLQKIVGFLERAERKADEKIAELQYCKAKIQLARKDYEKKRQGRQPVDGPGFLQEFPGACDPAVPHAGGPYAGKPVGLSAAFLRPDRSCRKGMVRF